MVLTSTTSIGRYAPSPTGDLHLGNLRTALLAWLVSRLRNGQFLLRIEDLDLPRVIAGSDQQIFTDLTWLGIDWDGQPVYQSQRQDLYHAAFAKLQASGKLYECFCSRKELRMVASAPHAPSSIYAGTCSNLSESEANARRAHKTPAWRLRVDDSTISFIDAVAGYKAATLSRDVGDFVVKRADGLYAYHLAVVVDDLAQGVTNVVRGYDLLSSSAQQIYLAHLLAPQRPPFEYWHVPLALDEQGARMAKRDGSAAAKSWRAANQSAAQLVGKFAYELGLQTTSAAISAQALLQTLTLERLSSALCEHQQQQQQSTNCD